MPPLTLYFLQSSRSIRIAYLLEELSLPYTLEFHNRANNAAPPALKQTCGTGLGRAPVLKDGDLTIQESGAITDYLCETYDTSHRLLPTDPTQRVQVRQWIHAAEGTFMVHCLPITYSRWYSPTPSKENGTLQELEEGLGINVRKDLDWLEAELAKGNGRFLVGDGVTAADTMMAFSVQFILVKGLGSGGGGRGPGCRRGCGIWKARRDISELSGGQGMF